MTLHADFELLSGWEARGIDNVCPDLGRLGIALLREPHVLAARTVAPLAIDAFRQCTGKDRLFTAAVRRRCRISVMAEQALGGYSAPEAGMRRPVVPRN